MVVALIPREVPSAKVAFLHYFDLVKYLRDASYLRQERDESFSHVFERTIELFNSLKNDFGAREEIKKDLDYEFNFTLVGRHIQSLQDAKDIHYLEIRTSLHRLEEGLEDKRKSLFHKRT